MWAGSVEINNVLPLFLEISMAIDDDVVVLPTPPFPPTKINFKVLLFVNSYRFYSIIRVLIFNKLIKNRKIKIKN